MAALKHRKTPDIRLRPGRMGDLAALAVLEMRVFSYDQISRTSFRRFLASRRTASVIVAEHGGTFAGYALVLFRKGSRVARLYSIAVADAGRGVGPKLLAAAEAVARRRRCQSMRLEVHEANTAAISRYNKAGYVPAGRRAGYYTDGADALHFVKRLTDPPPAP